MNIENLTEHESNKISFLANEVIEDKEHQCWVIEEFITKETIL